MKMIFVLLSGFLACLTVPAAAHPASSLDGTWEFVSGVYRKDGEIVASETSDTIHSTKILAGHHFAYVTSKGDGSFYVAASGHFQADHGLYRESIDLSSVKLMIGKDYSFHYDVKGDLWHFTGAEEGIVTEEVWRRVK